jgi:hypothetical protein
MGVILFLVLRAAHVLLAALWLGAGMFFTLFLGPAIGDAGPAGGPVMAALGRCGFLTYMAAVPGTTVLTGIYLYWRFTGGFDHAVMATHAGLAFGSGGLFGLAGLIIGGSVIGRSSRALLALGEKIQTLPPAERGAAAQEMAKLTARADGGGKVVAILTTIAIVLMALGHYI